MTGVFYGTKSVTKTGSSFVDAVLGNKAWDGGTISYSFPQNTGPYDAFFPYDGNYSEPSGFSAVSFFMAETARWALDKHYGGTNAQDGFSVEGFTNLNIFETTDNRAALRLAETSVAQVTTAIGYFPAGTKSGGDIWFKDGRFSIQQLGTYEWLTVLHEIGHALGLEHAHEAGNSSKMPAKWDTMEYTIMTYRSFVGHNFNNTGGYSNSQFDYAQSYMMADIYALQQMYGANYKVNSGKTVYKWAPNNGTTMVNGQAGIVPGDNVIFATIWDGGGLDTYDLSAYKSRVVVDLTPGSFSVFSKSQLADLDGNDGDSNGKDTLARGNIFNALMFNGNKKSLIENAKGGSGNDKLTGNVVKNKLIGNGGNDALFGGKGNDVLLGGKGKDKLNGQAGKDKLKGQAGNDTLKGLAGNDRLDGAKGDDKLIGGKGKDKLVYKKGYDRDTIVGMANNKDTIVLDDNLWKGTKSVNKVLNQFGHMDGSDFVLNFGGGDVLTVKNMTKTQLQDDINIV